MTPVVVATLLTLASCRARRETPTPSPGSRGAAPHDTAAGERLPDEAHRSRGAVHIAFTATNPHAYCRKDDCSGTPLVTLRRADATPKLVLSPGPCPVRCEDCRAATCPTTPCPGVGVPVAHAELDWDGSYYEAGVCGSGVACVTKRRATQGRYVAEVCAARGERTNDSIGFPVCIESGDRVCGSVEIDFPRQIDVRGTW